MIVVLWEKVTHKKSTKKHTLTTHTRRYRKTFNDRNPAVNEAKATIFMNQKLKQGHTAQMIKY